MKYALAALLLFAAVYAYGPQALVIPVAFGAVAFAAYWLLRTT